MDRDALAVQVLGHQFLAKGLHLACIRIDDDEVQIAQASQLRDETSDSNPPNNAVAVADLGRIKEGAGSRSPFIGRGGWCDGLRVDTRLGVRCTKTVDPAFLGDYEQPVIRSQQTNRRAP